MPRDGAVTLPAPAADDALALHVRIGNGYVAYGYLAAWPTHVYPAMTTDLRGAGPESSRAAVSQARARRAITGDRPRAAAERIAWWAMDVRTADPREIEALATIWHDGWHEAHAALLPPSLVALRTRESFLPRLAAAFDRLRAIGPPGDPSGLCIVHGDELQHLYVPPAARGTGAAVALLEDGESRIAASGATVAWLSCAIGNLRAARFYEKRGWTRTGEMTYQAEIAGGAFPVDVWRYEKRLA